MIPCKDCSLAKIQHHSLFSLNRVPHKHFAYDTVLRNPHCERPKIQHHSLSSLIRVPHHHFTYDTVLRYTHCERPHGILWPTYSSIFDPTLRLAGNILVMNPWPHVTKKLAKVVNGMWGRSNKFPWRDRALLHSWPSIRKGSLVTNWVE
jgi:hypothetical protein